MLREQAPGLSRVLLDRAPVRPGNTEFLQGDPLAVQHPQDVVIGDQKQRRGVEERVVVVVPSRIGMPVGADDGKPLHLLVQAAGDPPLGLIRFPISISAECHPSASFVKNQYTNLLFLEFYPHVS